jgi:hypothetical protein
MGVQDDTRHGQTGKRFGIGMGALATTGQVSRNREELFQHQRSHGIEVPRQVHNPEKPIKQKSSPSACQISFAQGTDYLEQIVKESNDTHMSRAVQHASVDAHGQLEQVSCT